MSYFLFAFAVFLILHLVPAWPALRQGLIDRLGRAAYFAIYSLLSLVALGFVFDAALQLDFIALWQPAAWQAWVTLLFAPLGIFLVLAGLFSRNARSISLHKADDRPGAIVAITRHPVLWGFLIWATGHIVANGDVRSAVLFGGFALFSIGGFLMLEKRARRRLGDNWSEALKGTSVWPLAAIAKGEAALRIDPAMIVAALATAAITALLLFGGHQSLFGVDPLVQATAF
ncbi:MAG TPA: NnrU family protein [Ensifer sp.]|jgi:uncharacterized membrane protein|uniref:NnrU family protein n=1 Tax=Ensifer sp. TaxID=1872086 RepID=UPI002E10F8C0|nr:NnrU family protein [Ensifer sp.]